MTKFILASIGLLPSLRTPQIQSICAPSLECIPASYRSAYMLNNHRLWSYQVQAPSLNNRKRRRGRRNFWLRFERGFDTVDGTDSSRNPILLAASKLRTNMKCMVPEPSRDHRENRLLIYGMAVSGSLRCTAVRCGI